ncbi:MAG: metallophosphoesterase [Rickettsiaceae bacterium]|nr:MAG: metallophosphoesterase [Rickettsiaceae bacterium]
MKFIIMAILTLLNSYVILKITNVFFAGKCSIQYIALIILILVGCQSIVLLGESHLLLKIERRLDLSWLLSATYQFSYLLFGIISCLFFYILFMDILNIGLRLSLANFNSDYFNKFSLSIIMLTTIYTTTVGFIRARKGPVVQKVEISLKNLPVSFDKFKIVQISDLHVGSIIKQDYVTKVVQMVNSLEPNLIALTGDFVDGRVKNLKGDVSPLSQMKSTYGSFFVTGNHEYYSHAGEWVTEFTNLGIHNLSNEHVLIQNNQDMFVLAGVTDYSTIKNFAKNISSPKKALEGAPIELVKILLAHQPASYIEAKKAGVDLQLSGHTHGGQYFPFTLLIRLFHRYYKGLNFHDGMWIYINRGTGYWGPPIRSELPSEITLITLRSAN